MERIPADVRRFVLTSVPTVPHLEALLLLHRHRDEAWSAPDLARRLYVDVERARGLLDELHARGLADRVERAVTGEPQHPARYRFPQADELASIVEAVESTYATQLVELSRLIHSKTDRKAQQFADAFAWKKEDHR